MSPAPRDTWTVDWRDGAVRLIDQRLLPGEFRILELRTPEEVGEAIRSMAVRGAPAIGAAAALGLALAALRSSPDRWLEQMRRYAAMLAATRPTAVNLFWALDRVMRAAEAAAGDPSRAAETVVALAQQMLEEDVRSNRALGAFGAPLLPEEGGVLTHCNTGSLATVYYGTALGVIRTAVERGQRLHVWADETRPRLQGMKLTAWECLQLGIPVTVIADGAAASLMRAGEIRAAIVGADRIAANGDTANKIGTYSVALAAAAHRIPFYVAAPLSTVDFGLQEGSAIPIEERAEDELTHAAGVRLAPQAVRVRNPAFDVTPATLIAAIITDRGVARPPFDETLAALRAAARG